MAKLVTTSVLDFVCEDSLSYTIIRLALVSAKSRLSAVDTDFVGTRPSHHVAIHLGLRFHCMATDLLLYDSD